MNKIINYKTKIRGSAIQYALICVMIIAFLLGGLVLFAGVSSKLQLQFDLQDRIIDNVSSAIEYGKSVSSDLPYDETVKLDLFDSEIDQVQLTKKNWGAYNYIEAVAIHPSFSYKQTEMLGSYQTGEQYALYLTDRGSGLALCGKTIIDGRAVLPKKGVKRAYIAGQNFEGDKLVNGTIGKSEKELPSVDLQYLNQIQKPLLWEKLPWFPVDSIFNSFLETPMFFFSQGPISISETSISGHVIIESLDSVFIGKTAILEDVIIKAPVIHIEAGFEGTAQFLASHKITVSENVTLKYPSVLALFENEAHDLPSTISIGDDANVLGSVVLHSSINNFRKEVFLDIRKGSSIYGLVYCEGATQLKGKVVGSMVTNKFFLKTQSSSYENHLLNATITGTLPEQFCVVPILKNNYKTINIKTLK